MSNGERKYRFGYHMVNGEPYSLMWAEDNGVVVGGIPTNLVGDVIEITEEEFKGELNTLEKQYPLVIEGVVVPTVPTRPDST